MAVKTDNRNAIEYDWDKFDDWDINGTMLKLSYLASPWVKDEITALPASPADNESHIVKAGSSAPLDSKANKIAYYKDGSWLYYDPPVNVPIYMSAQNNYWRWSGATWEKDCLSNIKGFVFINADGSTTGTNGITSVAKTGTGQYTITTSMVSNQVKKYDWWDVFIPHTPGLGGKDVSIDSAGDKIWINVKDTAGAAVDSMLRVSFS